MKISEIIYKGLEEITNLKSLVSDKLYGVPDAIIIGETHTDMNQAYTEAKIIEKYRPKYVLLEAFDNKTPQELKEKVDFYKVRTLEEICEKYRVSLEEIGIREDLIQKIDKEIKNELDNSINLYEGCKKYAKKLAKMEVDRNGYVPKNLKELKTKPLYELHPAVIDTIYNSIDDAHKEIKKDVLKYKRDSNIGGIENRRIDIVLSTIVDTGAEVAGCDINKSDIVKEVGRIKDELLDANTQLYELFGGNINKDNVEEFAKKLHEIFEKTNKEESNLINKHNPEREQVMYERIKEYLDNRSSDTPIIAIVGRNHTYNIGKKLEKDNVKYRIINPPSLENPVHSLFYRG